MKAPRTWIRIWERETLSLAVTVTGMSLPLTQVSPAAGAVISTWGGTMSGWARTTTSPVSERVPTVAVTVWRPWVPKTTVRAVVSMVAAVSLVVRVTAGVSTLP